MKIGSISSYSFSNKSFAGQDNKVQAQVYENPISRRKEKALATLSVAGGSAVLGLVAAGLATCLNISKKTSGLVGLAAAALSFALVLPSKLYNTSVNAFAREKEMDVFSRDKKLQSSLTEEVHKEVLDPNVSLAQKLENNLMLQMGNKAQGLVIR